MATAIHDNLIILLHEALEWLDLSMSFLSVKIKVNASPPASTAFFTNINGIDYSYTSGASPTQASVAAGIVAALVAVPGVIATDNHDGTYKLVGVSSFALVLDLLQDVVAGTRDQRIVYSFIEVAKVMADCYVNNGFASTGAVVIPDDVKTGVLQLISELYKSWKIGNGQGIVIGPIEKQDAGNLSVTYTNTINYGNFSMSSYVRSILSHYRYMAGTDTATSTLPSSTTFTEMWAGAFEEPKQ